MGTMNTDELYTYILELISQSMEKENPIKDITEFLRLIENPGNVAILKHLNKNPDGINIRQLSLDLNRPYNNIYKNTKLLIKHKLIIEQRNTKELNELLLKISKRGIKVVKSI